MNTNLAFRAGPVVCVALGCWLLAPVAPAPAQVKPPAADKQEQPLTEVIPLKAPDAEQVTAALRAMFGSGKTGAPFIEYFPHRGALLVRGTAEQLREVKGVLFALGEGNAEVGNARTIIVDRGSAATLARAIQRLLMDIKPGTPKKNDKGLFDPKPGKAQPLLIAVGNKLIVTTDDPELMKRVRDLANLLMQDVPICDFEVIRLKYHDASRMALLIDEAFNGPRAGKGGFQSGTRPAERVRVVADPAVNALLLRASPLDTLTIRHLIEELDVQDALPPKEQPAGDKKVGKKTPVKSGV
jgi:type II secretory pathway component GspD/PulD (secretin)